VNRISAVIISYNEQEKIESCLCSLSSVADQIIVVDSFSTDDTLEICRRHADKIVQRPWTGYRDQKQFAVSLADHDWVLSIDADERLAEELAAELRAWKDSTPRANGYFLPRRTFFLGRWIRYTTWYPDWQMRLFRKSKGNWEGGRVHESFRVQGRTGKMKAPLEHFTYSSLSEYATQLERFSSLKAADQYEAGQRAGLLKLVCQPPAIFFKNYLLRLGFLDGVPGFAVSALSAVSRLFQLLKLWELQNSNRSPREDE
jgi:glycosyltransferase involved in cell wall biosynthesis